MAVGSSWMEMEAVFIRWFVYSFVHSGTKVSAGERERKKERKKERKGIGVCNGWIYLA